MSNFAKVSSTTTIQPGEKLMGNLIGVVLDALNFSGHPGQRHTIGANPLIQQPGRLDNSVSLFFQQIEKFFFTGK